jgi:hypothetical protein
VIEVVGASHVALVVWAEWEGDLPVGSARLWINLQARYDLEMAQRKMPAERLERVPELT